MSDKKLVSLVLLVLIFTVITTVFSLGKVSKIKEIEEEQKTAVSFIILDDEEEPILYTEEEEEILVIGKHSVNQEDREFLRYKPLDVNQIKEYLQERTGGCAIAEGDYLNELDRIAGEYNVDPYFMLAITGQEQQFAHYVSKSYDKIILNPWNVNGSWQVYGESFTNSCAIACGTVDKLLSKCTVEEEVEIVKFINKTYAEDANWGKGVYSIYKEFASLQ